MNGTGKHPSVPNRAQRPPTIQRVESPPTPRIARPSRQKASSHNLRRGLLILGAVFLLCALLACGIGYAAFNYLNGINASSGAASAVSGFLTAMSGPQPNYDEAYKDLGPAITLQVSQQEFTQQAQQNDRCYGVITNYTEIAGSAKVQGDSQMYSYTVTRSKLKKPYQVDITLQQDQNSSNSWKVTSFNDNPGDGQSTCK